LKSVTEIRRSSAARDTVTDILKQAGTYKAASKITILNTAENITDSVTERAAAAE